MPLVALALIAAFLAGAAVAWGVGLRRARQGAGMLPRAFFDALPAFIILKDTKNRLLQVNAAAAARLGRSVAELEGQKAEDVFLGGARYFDDDLEVIRTGEPRLNKVLPFAQDTRLWTRTDKVPLKDASGQVTGIVVQIQDVTEQKLTERRLEEALETAKRASRAKSDFLSVVSHEIRTPLGVILGFSELLLSHPVPEKMRLVYTEKIQRNGKRLQKLIDDILDVSRIEQGQIAVEATAFALRPLIADMESTFRAKAAAKGIGFEVDVDAAAPPTVVSDPNRLRQIIANVVDNAIKFTASGKVTVGVRTEAQANGRSVLRVTVQDTGAGVPQEARDRLFQPFTQLDAAARMQGGVGLGLSLSKRLAEALGGDLTLEASQPGQGSTFLLRVDAGAVATTPGAADLVAGAAPGGSGAPLLAGLTLLLVEDYPDIQEMIRRFVDETGLALLSAENGRDGVALALRHRPDLVLMDLQLPEIDGMRATSELRGKGFTAPIIAMTAHAMKGQQQACLDAGFDDFISKPLSREELLERLRRFALKGQGR